MGKVENYIKEEISKKGGLLFALIDPVDYKQPSDAISAGAQSAEGGADIILIGGSIGVQGELLDSVTKQIKEKANVPVVLFPGEYFHSYKVCRRTLLHVAFEQQESLLDFPSTNACCANGKENRH